MSNHTTGQWETFILDKPLTEVPAYVEKCISASPGADFYFVMGKDERGEVDIAHVGNGPRAKENARLIAAAPDMLAALNFMNQCSAPMTSQQEECWELIRAAIAKATGETA